MEGIVSCILPMLLTGCGLSIYEDWQANNNKAITGGGAVAGKDYINGLLPSENSRKYFTQISANSDQPIETVSRTDDTTSKSGVRFVKNGGIVIPPGTTISYTNKGYCMDPNLPAPKSGEEFQLVPMAQLIPEELQGTYKKLLEKASSGDTSVQFNMQHLVWALRTAGTDAAYANNLTTQQKRILDRCSDYQGQFEDFHATAKSNSKMMKELLGLADSYLNVKIGGVSYKASDLLDPDIGSKKINEHLNQLIDMSKYLPVENTGFNYGELQSGIYTDVKGCGSLQFTARIANSTNQPFIYYPQNYVGQVGSGTKSQGFTFFATANSSMRQRTTQSIPERVNITNNNDGKNDLENECRHVWKVTEKQTKKSSAPDVEDINRKQEEHRNKKREVEKARKRLLVQLANTDDKISGLEYGAVIYSFNGEIYTSQISSGNYAYELGSMNGTPMQRVTLGDDGYYYIVQKNGRYVDPPKRTESKYGDYANIKNKTAEISYEESNESGFLFKLRMIGLGIGNMLNLYNYFLCESGSWNPDKFSLPEGAIPLEYVHLHPGESKLSYQDLRLASERGVNITVVTPKGNDTTFYPEDLSYTSTSDSRDLKSQYSSVENELFHIFSYECVKCGEKK